MNISRRDFVKAVAAAAVLPAVGSSSPASASAVNRRNMWSPDRTSDETLRRCNGILAADPNNVLALVHRGQVPVIYTDQEQAWKDLSRAIYIEPTNPCVHYIRGVCFDNSQDLQNAIALLSRIGDIDGKAICTGQPDIYHWTTGTDDGELFYMSHRELGFVLEQGGRYDEALAAFEVVASFQVISQADLERWTSPQVGRWCESVVGYKRLIEIEPRPEYFQRLEECERWMRVPRKEWWARHQAETC